MKPENKPRAEFEAWRRKRYNFDDLDAFEIEFAFAAFKAGRATMQSQKPEPNVAGLMEARGETMWFALSEMVKWYENTSLGNNPAFQYYDLAKKALLSATLQSQPARGYPCKIVEADFEAGTVTLQMDGQFTASAGQKYLCDYALQSQDREGYAGVTVWVDRLQCTKIITRIQYEGSNADDLLRHFEAARAAIDHARRIEEEGE